MALRKTADLFSCRGWEGERTGASQAWQVGTKARGSGAASQYCYLRTLAPAVPSTWNILPLVEPISLDRHKN